MHRTHKICRFFHPFEYSGKWSLNLVQIFSFSFWINVSLLRFKFHEKTEKQKENGIFDLWIYLKLAKNVLSRPKSKPRLRPKPRINKCGEFFFFEQIFLSRDEQIKYKYPFLFVSHPTRIHYPSSIFAMDKFQLMFIYCKRCAGVW